MPIRVKQRSVEVDSVLKVMLFLNSTENLAMKSLAIATKMQIIIKKFIWDDASSINYRALF